MYALLFLVTALAPVDPAAAARMTPDPPKVSVARGVPAVSPFACPCGQGCRCSPDRTCGCQPHSSTTRATPAPTVARVSSSRAAPAPAPALTYTLVRPATAGGTSGCANGQCGVQSRGLLGVWK